MINAISNNFGAEAIALKSHIENNLIVLQGIIPIDVTNSNYKSCENLEIVFDTQFPFTESMPSSVFIVSGTQPNTYGTILKSWIKEGNKLVIERLTLYDKSNNVKLYIASAFAKSGVTEQLQQEAPLELSVTDSTYSNNVKLKNYSNIFKENWGAVAVALDTFTYVKDTAMSFALTGFPTDTDVEFPIFLSTFDEFDSNGHLVYLARITGGILSIDVESGYSAIRQPDSFFSFFFVREPAAV